MEYLNKHQEKLKEEAVLVFGTLTSIRNPNRKKFFEEFLEQYKEFAQKIDKNNLKIF